MAFFEHAGIRFRYSLFGTGPKVVFCHGLTGDLRNSLELIGPLPDHQLLVWDARAHGETMPVGPAAELTFATFARDLNALFSHLGIDKAVVGGVSMGAATATRFTLDYSQHVAALVLVRPAWLDQPNPEAMLLYPQVADCLERYGCDGGRVKVKTLREYQSLLSKSTEDAQGIIEQFDRPLAVERSARLRNIPGDCPINNWEEIRSLNVPALVVGNDQDLVHPLSYAETWAQRLPQGQLVQVPSRPKEFEKHVQAFRGQLAQFLTSIHW